LTRWYYFRKYEDVTRRLPIATLSATPEHVDALKALAHPGRLDVFFTIVKARREMAAGEVQEALEIPGPTLSHHLDQLRRAGLLRARRKLTHF
jgi:DNA-binding transcriptional ArsR family regulator